MDKDKQDKLNTFFRLGYDNLIQIKTYFELSQLKEWQKFSPTEKIEVVCNFNNLYLDFCRRTGIGNGIWNILAAVETKNINDRKFVNDTVMEYEEISKLIIMDYFLNDKLLTKKDKINYLYTLKNEYTKLQLKYKFDSPFTEDKILLNFINQQMDSVNKLTDDIPENTNKKLRKEKEDIYTFESKFNEEKLKKLCKFLKDNEYIHNKTNENDFIKIFNGIPIKEINHRIKWIDLTTNKKYYNKHTLFTLINKVCNKKIQCIPNLQKIIIGCFVEGNNVSITPDNLKSSFSLWNTEEPHEKEGSRYYLLSEFIKMLLPN